MTTAEALKREIDGTPEPILQETYDFLLFLKGRGEGTNESPLSRSTVESPSWPDFLGRLRDIYGERVGNDSQQIMDYLREERG